ncbi:MAG: DUF4258 domain-containing protein [Deltaproteobacteria bacterium]|jgi:hypothetical protein|nr:DUF4258 domain-containing protein [Deltaproteobacteria bacterium]
MNHDQLVDIIQQGRIEWSAHALKRMLEKGISRASVKHIICTGEMIENYPDDKPFPSGLFYEIWQNQPLHAVIAYDLTEQKIFSDYNGFRGGSNFLILLHHKIILIDQITIY